MNSILTSVKKLLGIAEECTDFDADIIMYINMALFALVQMGVGPGEGYAISGKENEWTEFVADPVKVDQEYEADENGEASLLDTESLQLDTPEDVWLYEEDGYLCLEYSHVDANDGYYVVVYKGSDRLLSVYTDVDEEQLVLTEMDPSWQGKRFYAKVKALGSVYDSTEDSEFGDSETFRWE